MTEALIQGTDEWRQARCGSLGASQVATALAKLKSGAWGEGRKTMLRILLAERLTGAPVDGYVSAEMRIGTEREPDARAAYAWKRDLDVVEVGIIRHPRIAGTHASPDGLVGDDGLIEIKCPNKETHAGTLDGEPISGKYITQMQWQMSCTGRQWCDFVSYHPDFRNEGLDLFVTRIPRNDTLIASLEKDVAEFLAELGQMVERIRAYGLRAAA